jgi:HJR/Mrr/RecB family endonuclease
MIARYIEHGGFLDVTIVGGTGDLGADIVGSFNDKRWVLQAKFRTSVNTGKAAVIEAFTAHWSYDADVIVAATNKKFTDESRQYVVHAYRIQMITYDIGTVRVCGRV